MGSPADRHQSQDQSTNEPSKQFEFGTGSRLFTNFSASLSPPISSLSYEGAAALKSTTFTPLHHSLWCQAISRCHPSPARALKDEGNYGNGRGPAGKKRIAPTHSPFPTSSARRDVPRRQSRCPDVSMPVVFPLRVDFAPRCRVSEAIGTVCLTAAFPHCFPPPPRQRRCRVFIGKFC